MCSRWQMLRSFFPFIVTHRSFFFVVQSALHSTCKLVMMSALDPGALCIDPSRRSLMQANVRSMEGEGEGEEEGFVMHTVGCIFHVARVGESSFLSTAKPCLCWMFASADASTAVQATCMLCSGSWSTVSDEIVRGLSGGWRFMFRISKKKYHLPRGLTRRIWWNLARNILTVDGMRLVLCGDMVR